MIMKIFNLMSKAVEMFMHLLISMLKLNASRVITSTMLNNMACRLVILSQEILVITDGLLCEHARADTSSHSPSLAPAFKYHAC